jgi:NADH-quinone oxidoreductase subunit L
MGGLRKLMPVTFLTYAVGMAALSGVPVFFSGFWSKDEILHAAHGWSVSHWPFYLGVFGALLTAFYMTRQVCYVFFGNPQTSPAADKHPAPAAGHGAPAHGHEAGGAVHESPGVMTLPLVILAGFAIALGFIGTPAWPWFQTYLEGEKAKFDLAELTRPEILPLLLFSTVIVFTGIILGWWFYGRPATRDAAGIDPLEKLRPDIFVLLRNKFYVDEFYEATIIRFNAVCARFFDDMDYWIWNGLVKVVSLAIIGLAWVNRSIDEYVVNLGFDGGCRGVKSGGSWLSSCQDGQVQQYLRFIGVALAALILILIWGL